MNLRLERNPSSEQCTIGALAVDGSFFCDTLEDVVREEKIPGETAIPAGSYKVILDYSPHFGQNLPHVLNVPGFEGVRIHSGNTDKDTEGCILVGHWQQGDTIINSRATLADLLRMLQDAWFKGEEVWLEIVNAS